jgi:hypothetical protein
VDAIELSVPSTIAENWDDNPGPDGVWAMVRCYKLTPKTTAVTVSGTLEFLLFEGRVEPADLAKTKPFRVWTYRPDELPDYLYRHLLYGYRMQLAWVDRVPRTDVVTLTARYIPPSGEPIYALPVSITMTAK